MKSYPHRLLLLGACSVLAACAASTPHVLVGQSRPPITPDQVKVYSDPPAHYELVSALNASSKSIFRPGKQKSVDQVIERLKIQAAKVGANGVILQGFSDTQTASLGTGVGTDSYSGHSAVGVGVGGALGIYKKTGRADAIYVPPAADPATKN